MHHDYIEQHQVIEEYVMGRLPEAEAARFEDHYLTCEECLRRLDLAERFQTGFRDVVAEELAGPVGLAAIVAGLARRRWAAAAGVLAFALVLAGAGFLFWRTLQLDRELDEAHATLARSASRQSEGDRRAAEAEQRAGALQERLAAETQARGRLEEELSRQRRPRAGAAWVVALVPARSGPAAGEPFQRISPPPGEQIVLALDLDLPGPGPYRVTLRRRDSGAMVWEGAGLRPGPAGTLAVGLDSALLPPGDYRLLVEQGGAVPVAHFTFRVGQ